MSNIKKEEKPMANAAHVQSASIPLPSVEKRRLVQAEIRTDLFQSVEREIKKQGLTIRQVVEYGFSEFLCKVNPAEARRLGIIQNK